MWHNNQLFDILRTGLWNGTFCNGINFTYTLKQRRCHCCKVQKNTVKIKSEFCTTLPRVSALLYHSCTDTRFIPFHHALSDSLNTTDDLLRHWPAFQRGTITCTHNPRNVFIQSSSHSQKQRSLFYVYFHQMDNVDQSVHCLKMDPLH